MELSAIYTSTTPGLNHVICKYKIKTYDELFSYNTCTLNLHTVIHCYCFLANFVQKGKP